MAARNLNTNTDADRIARRDAIVASLLSPSKPRGGNFSDWLGDKVAATGKPASVIAAGARAAVDNAALEYQVARKRQAIRTANRALEAAEELANM